MKRMWVYLILFSTLSVVGIWVVYQQDHRLSVDHGHYVGRGSVPGAHDEETATQETGFTFHTRYFRFYDEGSSLGSIKALVTLYGYEVYTIYYTPISGNSVSIRFIYDKETGKGWLSLHQNSGVVRSYFQEMKLPLGYTQTIMFSEKEAQVFQVFCKEKFPKIRTEDLEHSGVDGMRVYSEYIFDGEYDCVSMWCPTREKAPTYIEVIEKMIEPFEKQQEELKLYLD